MSNNTYQLPIWDTISVAWSKVPGAKGSFWAAIGIFIVIMFGIGILQGIVAMASGGVERLMTLIANVVSYFIGLGIIYMGISRAQDRPINFQMMFHAFNGSVAIRVIGLYLIQLVIFLIPVVIGGFAVGFGVAAGGFLAFISFLIGVAAFIALLIIGVRMSLSMGYVLDRETGPWHAVTSSFQATKGNFWNLLGLFILQTIIVVISALPLLIGLIWTLPFAYICYGTAYHRLSNNA